MLYSLYAVRILAASAVGLLLGGVAGVSISPVVSGLFTVLGGIISVVFMSSDKNYSSEPSLELTRLRDTGLFVFATFAMLGLWFGVQHRTASMDIEHLESAQRWKRTAEDLGLSKDDALYIARLYLISSVSSNVVNTDTLSKPHASVLYSDKTDYCEMLEPGTASTRELCRRYTKENDAFGAIAKDLCLNQKKQQLLDSLLNLFQVRCGNNL